MLDLLSGSDEPGFNNDPFQLGTYDQIAHFRGGRGGRAREFKISLRKNLEVRKGRISETSGSFTVEIQVSFGSVESHAGVKSVRITSNNQSLETALTADGIQTSFVNERNERTLLDEPRATPPVARAEFARYWPFLLRELRFRLRRKVDDSQENLFETVSQDVIKFSDLADALSRQLPSILEATSAIRTRPQRTYTPGTETQDGEGSHVPYEIAKLYRSRSRERAEWDGVKNAIERFGQQSDMFKEMSVKSFGQTASDPFQIQFSSDGPKTNLVDLGYGTSQVLPILYSIASGRSKNFFLIQQPEVHLHPKAQAALGQYFVDFHKRSGIQFVLETHSDFIVDRIRRAISDRVITKDDVSILFFERERLENRIVQIHLDDTGEPIDPPDSYRSFFIGEQLKNLGL